jgi:hypothetical protein
MDDAIEKLNQAKEDSSSDSLRQAMQQERSAYEGLLKNSLRRGVRSRPAPAIAAVEPIAIVEPTFSSTAN